MVKSPVPLTPAEIVADPESVTLRTPLLTCKRVVKLLAPGPGDHVLVTGASSLVGSIAGAEADEGADDPCDDTPVTITTRAASIPDHRNLVINLCADPVPEPGRFRRLLEIVPAQPELRTASRVKYKLYRDQGLNPETHKMG